MSYVIKEVGRPLYVDLNNPTKIYDKKEGEKLFSLGRAQKRTEIGIILYTELDFNEFYKKHCDRIPNDEKLITKDAHYVRIPNLKVLKY